MLGGACNATGYFIISNFTLPHIRRFHGYGQLDRLAYRLVHSGFCQSYDILTIDSYRPPAYHPRPPLARLCRNIVALQRVLTADFSVLCQSRELRPVSSNAVSGGAFQGVTPSFHSSENQLGRTLFPRRFYFHAGISPLGDYMRQRVAAQI